MQHPDPHVEQALTRLNDALCTWERATGRESVLILRDSTGFAHRSMSGKPGVPEDLTDDNLLSWFVPK
jgi:hypothetical protein